MLRINLLPPYIYEGAKRRNVVVLWALVLAAVVGGFIFWKMQLNAEAERIAKMTQDETPDADLADRTQSEADKITADNAKTRAKWEFVSQAKTHNDKDYVQVYDHVRDFTIDRVLYDGITPANDQVQISAYAPTLADVGHYMLAMERNPNIKNLTIAMNSVPSFPVASGGGQQQNQGQDLGMGGGMPGMGAPPGMMRGRGGGGSGSGGGPTSIGAPSAGQIGGGFSSPGGGFSGGRGGGFGGGAGGQASSGARPPSGGGHDFAVTLTLSKPIPGAPTYPAGGGGGGQAQQGMAGMGMGSGGAPAGMGSGAGGGSSMMGGGGMAPPK